MALFYRFHFLNTVQKCTRNNYKTITNKNNNKHKKPHKEA